MRSKVFLILGLSGILVAASCSASSGEKPKAKEGTAANGATNTVASVEGGNSNSAVANGMVVQPQPADANVATASTDQVQPPISDNLRDKLANMKTSSGSADAAAIAAKNARPAPDNSTFASYLTDVGYEIRTFKKHPQLLKVEKRTESNGSQSVKVFLRSGSVIQLAGNAIPNLASAPAAAILSVAGLTPAQSKEGTGPSTRAKSTVN